MRSAVDGQVQIRPQFQPQVRTNPLYEEQGLLYGVVIEGQAAQMGHLASDGLLQGQGEMMSVNTARHLWESPVLGTF